MSLCVLFSYKELSLDLGSTLIQYNISIFVLIKYGKDSISK